MLAETITWYVTDGRGLLPNKACLLFGTHLLWCLTISCIHLYMGRDIAFAGLIFPFFPLFFSQHQVSGEVQVY